MDIIFLEPVFKEMIWGGSRLGSVFGYEIPGDDTGECWAISAHPKGDCRIRNGEYKGWTLSGLWSKKRELFGNAGGEVFPLLTKIIDAKEDLSIQVHPDDNYARANEKGSLGKMECWYVLDCTKGASIVIGHNAKTKDELRAMIRENRWKDLIREIPVHKGDFFQINPGCVHAIKGGTMILETQQSSDITYRLYDYDRVKDGQKRELHIDKSIDVIEVPYKLPDKAGENKRHTENEWFEELVCCEKYIVWKGVVDKAAPLCQDKEFMLGSVIEGEGMIKDIPVKMGDHFILPSGFGRCEVKGKMKIIFSALPGTLNNK